MRVTPAVHWLLRSAGELPSDDSWLAAGERRVLARMTVPQRVRDWLLGRFAAKEALSAHLGESEVGADLGRLEIRAASDGAPEAFSDGEPLPVSLSLSHRAGHALGVVADAGVALGGDLEKVEARSELFVEDYFTHSEQSLVAACPNGERARVENLIWSAKESVLKALRVGLTVDSRRVEVELPEARERDGWWPFTAIYRPAEERFAGWWRCYADFVITLAAAPPVGLPVALDGNRRPD